MTKILYRLIVIFCLITASKTTKAQVGTLDETFGINGEVITDFSSGGEGANAMVLQSDGKIIVAGSSYAAGGLDGTGDDVVMVRYNTDGSLDNTFDSDGRVQTNLGSENEDFRSLAIQGDGKIIAVGFSQGPSYSYFAIVRYTSTGSLDNTFGSGGKVLTRISTGYEDEAFSVALQDDGKIVVAGIASISNVKHIAIARFNTNGSFDNTFDTDGKVLLSFGSNITMGYSVKIQSDGKIIVAGNVFDQVALARFHSNGSLDNTFDSDGKVTTTIGVDKSVAKTLELLSDGKILVAGFANLVAATTPNFAVARYNSNGSLDNTFDSDGIVMTSGTEYAQAIGLQSDGKFIVAGSHKVVRYNSNGSLDSSFGTNGIITTRIDGKGNSGNYDEPQSMVIQNDGKIVVAGAVYNSNYDIALARYNVLPVPVIVFSNIEKTYGDVPFNVEAGSDSPGAFTYSITSGGAFASITPEGLVSIIGAGTVTIKAVQSETENYTSSNASATLTINPAVPTLTYTGETTGDIGTTIALTFNSNSTGTVSFTVMNETGAASVSGNNLILSEEGTVTLTVNLAATENYEAKSIEQIITINSITGVDEPEKLNASIKIHPNPSSGSATIHLNITENSKGRLVLSDLNGRELKVIAEGVIDPKGYYNLLLSDYRTGVYLIKLHLNDRVLVCRFLKE